MIVTAKTGEDKGLNWNAKGAERIAQNVVNLISTFRYEIAYNRTLGIPTKLVDMPPAEAMALLPAEVMELCSRYEPRANIKAVNCAPAVDGGIEIEVVMDI